MISTLYVDDEPDLLDLGRIFLEQDPEFHVHTAPGVAEALRVLGREHIDVIISDYQMPERNGIEFLKEFRAIPDHRPFILFTGKGREEVVIEAINSGADFYLQKGGNLSAQFAELAHKIRQAVNKSRAETELKKKHKELQAAYELLTASEEKLRTNYENLGKSEEALRNSRNFLDSIIEQSPNAIAICDEKGTLISVNRACCGILNVTPEEIIGNYNVLDDNLVQEQGLMPLVRSVFEEGRMVRFEITYDSSHLTTTPLFHTVFVILDVTIFPIRDIAGKITNAVIQHNDITGRKRAEESLRASEEKYRGIFENATVAVFQTRVDGSIATVNPAFVRMLGYDTPEKVIRDVPDIRMIYVHPEVRDELFRILAGRGAVVDFEIALKRRDGSVLWASVNVRAVHDSDGKITGVDGLAVDITGRKRAEDELRAAYNQITASEWELRAQYDALSKSEDALRASERAYRTIFENTGSATIQIEDDMTISLINDTFEQFTGYSREEIEGKKKWTEFVFKEDLDHMMQYHRERRKFPDRAPSQYEFQLVTKNGDIKYVFLFLELIPGTKKSVASLFDLTERKRLEREVQESEERYRKLVEISPDAVILHCEGKIIYLNPAALNLLGASHSDEIIGKNVLDFIQPGFRDAVRINIQKDLGGDRTLPIELQMLRIDGTSVIVEGRGVRTFIDGIPVVQVAIRDITERKRAEEALRESEGRYRALVETTSDWMWEVDENGVYTYISPKIRDVLGYEPEGLLGKTPFDLMNPDEAHRIRAIFQEYTTARKPFSCLENTNVHKDGHMVVLETSGIPVFNADGKFHGYRGIDRDVSERKQAELALRESEERYRNVIETSFDAVVVHQNGNIVFVNQTGINLMGGTDASQFIGKPVLDFVHTDCQAAIRQRVARAPESVQQVIREKLLKLDGTPFDCEVATTPCTWNGAPAAQVVVRDITERIRTEKALRKIEEQYSQLFEHANDGITIVQDGIIKKFNSRFAAMVGHSPDDILNHTIAEGIHPEDLPMVLDRHVRRLGGEKNLLSMYTFRIITKEGMPIWVELNTSVMDWEGKPASLNIIRDITERKQAEVAIQQANKKLRLLSSITRHDVLNKLTALGGFIELAVHCEDLRKLQSLAAKQFEIVGQIQRMISFTQEYETIGDHSPEWQDLDSVMKKAAAELDFTGISLSVSLDGCEVLADSLLPKVFYNLMENSLRYGGDGMTAIRISLSQSGKDIVILVEDDGTGIDSVTKEHLFERGYGRNTGLGLFLAREILAITGITISEHGSSVRGTRFEIRMPNNSYRIRG